MRETYVTYFDRNDVKIYMKYLFNLDKKEMVLGSENGRRISLIVTGLGLFGRPSSMEEIQQEQFKLVIVL